MEAERTIGRFAEIVRIGGYLVAGGALVGFSMGVYLLFQNPPSFSSLILISQFEATSYFLSVFMPSFAVLIVLGYLFATISGPKKTSLSTVAPLCIFSLSCLVLSALSVFYFASFLGSFLNLIALIRAYTKPAFKTLSKTEAFFLVEIGALSVASFSALTLFMWLISNFFKTYMGLYASYSPYPPLMIGFLSFLVFFVIPWMGSKGTNAGWCGAFGLTMSLLSSYLFVNQSMSLLSYLFVVQNEFVSFNAPAFIGMTMLVLGLISALVGDLIYMRLFFSELVQPAAILSSSPLFQGRYCPYCGKPRVTPSQSLCSECGRSLMWTPYAPFCSSCGRLVPTNASTCPHCREDIRNKQIYFGLKDAQEQAIVDKLITESRKKKSWMMKGLLRISRMSQRVEKTLGTVSRYLNAFTERLALTLKEGVFMITLTSIFAFLSFIGYRRVEFARQVTVDILIFHYGFPLEWLQVKVNPHPSHVFDVGILWASLVLNIMLYFFMSFALVYGVTRLRR